VIRTQQGTKLTAADEVGHGTFGDSVALSADGNTAAIGGCNDQTDNGPVWVFARSGSSRAQQGLKLTASDAAALSFLGDKVALSGDGNTILAAGSNDHGAAGAAWAFSRSGTSWSQQGTRFTPTDASGSLVRFGSSLALTSDGNTALIGGSGDSGQGAIWLFTRGGGAWTQQGSKLTAGDESSGSVFGSSIALTPDGSSALIGGNGDSNSAGAAWLFVRAGSSYTAAAPKILPSDASGSVVGFGYRVALSADGTTALVGGPNDNSSSAPVGYSPPVRPGG